MTIIFSLPAVPASLLTSSLGLGVSSLGAGNWLVRVTARQSFFFPARQGKSVSRTAQIAQGFDHGTAGPIVGKSAHGCGCESPAAACHGAESAGLRHV